MLVTRIALGLIVTALFGSVAGCGLLGRKSNPFANSTGATPAAVVHGGPTFALTAFDKESLLRGAGPLDRDPPREFSETNSGLKYRVLRKSNGVKPNAGSTVTVDYRGWLDDGTEFDSSYKRGKPISFPLKSVIPGWTEGMQLIGTGGMVELWIPSVLGYGAQGSGSAVPPNATLHFIVELHEVK